MKPTLDECIIALEHVQEGDCDLTDFTCEDVRQMLKYLKAYEELREKFKELEWHDR